ncbi:PQQ-dependent sugar dehydrogenase [Alteromonas sediminis]|uniref:PQQ-dependent sugar dehydrogenase n=1 Tax=Alteromonas sediminis TaxID=2259342 RepID=A0A3N5ZAE9_9ALTE|nr:PQQ-dependent sugar dehydrogenase [Alteromonas sediminis]RPJ66418.1 PQQ-dependent sugar dehydrogenase [Alteromonas sediminis]
MLKRSLVAALVAGFSFQVFSQVESFPIADDGLDKNYELEKVADGVSIPWGMVWLNQSELLVTDRKGELRMIKDGSLIESPITGVPQVDARNQGGLLDIEKHPDYANNGWLYLSYSGFEGEGDGSNTSVVRARLDKNAMALTDVEVIFEGAPNTDNSRHYGSRLEFDNEGYLYITVGDRGDRDNTPQRLDMDGGKVHRIHDDGRVPNDNPFVGKQDANATVYSFGHRNPQGMAKHPETGALWAHEHGPRGGDELNKIAKGNNYGWPVISYGINYNGTSFTDMTAKEGMVQPNWQWTPSIAPSGMVFITSDNYPEWQGHMLVGSLKFGHVVLVKMDNEKITGHSKLFEGIGRVRSLSVSPDGHVYIGTDGAGIYKVIPRK